MLIVVLQRLNTVLTFKYLNTFSLQHGYHIISFMYHLGNSSGPCINTVHYNSIILRHFRTIVMSQYSKEPAQCIYYLIVNVLFTSLMQLLIHLDVQLLMLVVQW